MAHCEQDGGAALFAHIPDGVGGGRPFCLFGESEISVGHAISAISAIGLY